MDKKRNDDVKKKKWENQRQTTTNGSLSFFTDWLDFKDLEMIFFFSFYNLIKKGNDERKERNAFSG